MPSEVLEPTAIVASIVIRFEQVVERIREETSIDEDWVDEFEEDMLYLLRDLAVLCGIGYRSVDWEGEGEDPLDIVRQSGSANEIKDISVKGFTDTLMEGPDLSECDDEDLMYSHSLEDALSRIIQLDKLLHRSLEAEVDDIDELLGNVNSVFQ